MFQPARGRVLVRLLEDWNDNRDPVRAEVVVKGRFTLLHEGIEDDTIHLEVGDVVLIDHYNNQKVTIGHEVLTSCDYAYILGKFTTQE